MPEDFSQILNSRIPGGINRAFQIPDNVRIVKAKEFEIDKTVNVDPILYRSALGTPVFTNIEFLAGEYETNIKGIFKQFPPLRFDTVVLIVSQSKKIVKTEIQGRDGTVKEYIGMDDYQVTVNGIIAGENGQYPADEVTRLKKMLDAPIPIKVACNYLQNFDIYELVIESYDLMQDEGGFSYQKFSINCVSDVPQELRLSSV